MNRRLENYIPEDSINVYIYKKSVFDRYTVRLGRQFYNRYKSYNCYLMPKSNVDDSANMITSLIFWLMILFIILRNGA